MNVCKYDLWPQIANHVAANLFYMTYYPQVAYVAASLPYVVLTCLLIRGCLLPGAGDGLYYLMVPDWNKLADPEVRSNCIIMSHLLY